MRSWTKVEHWSLPSRNEIMSCGRIQANAGKAIRPPPRSTVVGVGQLAFLRLTIAIAQPGLTVLEILLDAVDPDRVDAGRQLERIAVPDHHVRTAPRA